MSLHCAPMEININRTAVSRGHRATSHGFRAITPGGTLSGIDEEDASPAGIGGASGGAGGARSGASTGAPQQELPNTTSTVCWDGRTLRSSSSTCSAYLYQNHKRRQHLQHLTSTSSSVRRCLAHSPHSHADYNRGSQRQSRSSRPHCYQEKHTHKPQQDIGEGHHPWDIASNRSGENTGTVPVSRAPPSAAWEGRRAGSGSRATGTVNNKSPVDHSVENRSVNCGTSNGTDACYNVTTSPETVVSSAEERDIAGGCSPVPSSTCLTNGHATISVPPVQSHPGRWAAIGEIPTEVTVPNAVNLKDISIEDICEETGGSDDVFAPDEPVLVTEPDPGSSLHPLEEVVDCCNQKAGRPGDNTGTCVCAYYGRLICRECPLAVDDCSRGASGGQPPAMFTRYRSSSIPDHAFRQRDLALIQTAVTSKLSDAGGGGGGGTVEMPGGALTTIVGAASAPAPSSETNREHAQLAPACIDARPSTCPIDGSADAVRSLPAAHSNTALKFGTLPHQGNAPEVGLTPPEDCDVPLKMPSAFSPHGGHYTPRRRELVRLSPLPVSPRPTETLETIGGAAARLSSSPAMAEHGFRPISPTRAARSNPTLHMTLIDSLPLPGSRYSRTPSPTLSVRSLSPGPHTRQRSNTFSGSGLIRGDLNSFLSPPRSPARLPRDAHQPSQGSISDLSDKHGDTEEAGEEADSFHFRPFQRQRSSTCPENRAWRRRKAAAVNRPPTPPPIGGSGSRNSSPRGSLGDTSRIMAGALLTLTPTHLTRRSDLSDLREDQDQGDDVADSAATKECPAPGDRTQKQLQNGGVVNSTDGDSRQSVALMERLCLQNKAPTETNNNLGVGRVPPGPLPALRH